MAKLAKKYTDEFKRDTGLRSSRDRVFLRPRWPDFMHTTSTLAQLLLIAVHVGCAPAGPRHLSKDVSPTVLTVQTDVTSPSDTKRSTFRLRLIIRGDDHPSAGPIIVCIEPSAKGELWVGGTENLRGILRSGWFAPFATPTEYSSGDVNKSCHVSTVTQSILAQSDSDVYFGSHQYCDNSTSTEFRRNALERYDGQAVTSFPFPESTTLRTDIKLHRTASNRFLATTSSIPSDEEPRGSLHEWTASGWHRLLALPSEQLASPVEDVRRRLWVAAFKGGTGRELPTRILHEDERNWLPVNAPAYGDLAVASDKTLLFFGLEGLWSRQDAQWVARPAPKTTSLFAVLARTERDIYFLAYPTEVIHFDGDKFMHIPIDSLGSETPTHLVWREGHIWLASFRRIWKLEANNQPTVAPVVLEPASRLKK